MQQWPQAGPRRERRRYSGTGTGRRYWHWPTGHAPAGRAKSPWGPQLQGPQQEGLPTKVVAQEGLPHQLEAPLQEDPHTGVAQGCPALWM